MPEQDAVVERAREIVFRMYGIDEKTRPLIGDRYEAQVGVLADAIREERQRADKHLADKRAIVLRTNKSNSDTAKLVYELEEEAKAAEERAEAAEKRAAESWRCFHCGFSTSDVREAEAHFGDRDDEEPLCKTIARWGDDETARQLQDTIQQLNAERAETARQRVQIEGLEYRVEGQRAEIQSFAPFRKCEGINDIFNLYDSMEGRALAAEERAAALEAALEEYGEHHIQCDDRIARGEACTCGLDKALRDHAGELAEHDRDVRKAALSEAKKAIEELARSYGDQFCGHAVGAETAAVVVGKLAEKE